jgi:hypothetical protein
MGIITWTLPKLGLSGWLTYAMGVIGDLCDFVCTTPGFFGG